MDSIETFGSWVRIIKSDSFEKDDSDLFPTISWEKDDGRLLCAVKDDVGRPVMYSRDSGADPEGIIESVMEAEANGGDIVVVLKNSGFTVEE